MSPKIERVFLEYRGDSIGLVPGENLVGRNIECRVRFNDAAVSRRHMRFLVLDNRLLAEDLGSSNGTWVNDVRLDDTRELQNGDVVEVGSRTLRVALHLGLDSESEDEVTAEKTENRYLDWTGAGDADGADESDDSDRHRRPTPARGTIAVDAPVASDVTPRRRVRTVPSPPQASPSREAHSLPSRRICPRCRSRVSFEHDICDKCSYRWPKGLPMTVTQPLRIADLGGAERRRHKRITVQIPVIYNSDLLCFDAVARDLSEGGVFLATDLLDEPGTECSLTMLPDGGQALSVHGVIRRVVQHGIDGLPGMGIQFADSDDEVVSQITALLKRRAP